LQRRGIEAGMFRVISLVVLLAGGVRASGSPCPDAFAAKDLLIRKCGGCHLGAYLNFKSFPFFSGRYLTLEALMDESIRRAELPCWGRMPPVNFPPLSADEIDLLKRWRASAYNQ
jgi:hypothetical protein